MVGQRNARPAPPRPLAPRLGIGLLGYGFMGKTHSNAYRTIPYIFWPSVVEPELVAICGRHEEPVAEAAARYGFQDYYTDWRDLVADDRIQVLDNSGPHELHAEPSIAAVQAGKHVLCEKPLAMNAADARRMWHAAEAAGVTHMCGFNYRFVPAVRLAREVIQQGLLGKIYHFRARYLQESAHAPNVPWPLGMGTAGALLILGCHILDINQIAHFLRAIATKQPVGPDGATFEDGYRAAAICDAIVESAQSGRRVDVPS